MSTPYLGQITAFASNFAPTGWAVCNGQLLPIAQNVALYSLLGTYYGGDGISTFALPNLQGSLLLGAGNNFTLAQRGGEETHTLSSSELPSHNHPMVASSTQANLPSPAGNYPAMTFNPAYGSSANTTLGPSSVAVGGNQQHPNQPPYLVLTFCIAVQGLYPPRS